MVMQIQLETHQEGNKQEEDSRTLKENYSMTLYKDLAVLSHPQCLLTIIFPSER